MLVQCEMYYIIYIIYIYICLVAPQLKLQTKTHAVRDLTLFHSISHFKAEIIFILHICLNFMYFVKKEKKKERKGKKNLHIKYVYRFMLHYSERWLMFIRNKHFDLQVYFINHQRVIQW